MTRTVALLLMVVLAAGMVGMSSADAVRGVVACRPSQVRLSISPPNNGFTGGRYPVAINLRNVSRTECSVEGHPLIVVSPHPFPVVVGDLADFDPSDPYIGPERVLDVKPGSSVHAPGGDRSALRWRKARHDQHNDRVLGLRQQRLPRDSGVSTRGR